MRAARPTPAPAAGAPSWADYWSRDRFWRDEPLWRANARRFSRRLEDVLTLGPEDVVLDIGCGPGYVADLLAPRVKRIHAVDVSAQFLERCRERCRRHPNVTVETLGPDYADLRGIGGPYTRILCVSVVQYYRDLGEVAKLIASARSVAAPGALMLIADLPRRRGRLGFAWDAACSGLQAVRGGYAFGFLRASLGWLAGGGGYRRFARTAGQLAFSPAELASFVSSNGLLARIVPEGLSVYANRPSLVIAL